MDLFLVIVNNVKYQPLVKQGVFREVVPDQGHVPVQEASEFNSERVGNQRLQHYLRGESVFVFVYCENNFVLVHEISFPGLVEIKNNLVVDFSDFSGHDRLYLLPNYLILLVSQKLSIIEEDVDDPPDGINRAICDQNHAFTVFSVFLDVALGKLRTRFDVLENSL